MPVGIAQGNVGRIAELDDPGKMRYVVIEVGTNLVKGTLSKEGQLYKLDDQFSPTPVIADT